MSERGEDSTNRERRQARERLSAEEERSLALRWSCHRDLAARRRLIESTVWLVELVANDFRSRPGERGDLVAEGNVALVVALDRFDVARGVRFATYARHWVRASMIAYLMRSTNALGSLARARHASRLRRELQSNGSGSPCDGYGESRRDLSLDAINADSGCSLLETLASECPDAEAELGELYWRATLTSAMSAVSETLDLRERVLLEARLSNEDDDGPTLEELALTLRLSRERVRQLDARMRCKVAAFLRPTLRASGRHLTYATA